MTIPYPSNYFGEIGEVECCECGTKLELDDSDTHETTDGYMCDECYRETEEEDE